MIYFDNAATSWPKPPGVKEALLESLENAGNPGRGTHSAAKWSAYKLFEVREKAAELFHVKDPLRIAFTMNATHALNIAANLCYGQIVITEMDHNSVLRPCVSRGYYHIVKADRNGGIEADKVIKSISDVTGAVMMTHISNVTGQIYDIRKIGAACREKGVTFIVDAAQSAGVEELDVEKMNIDVLCFTGHKGLFGIQGTGGIYVAPHVRIRPYMCGGTGSKSFELTQPKDMPDCFEAGTVNTHGVAALGAGLDFIKSVGLEQIRAKDRTLRQYFVERALRLPNVIVYGGTECPDRFAGVVSINIKGRDPVRVGSFLGDQSVCSRPGFHCAPLAHRAIGTQERGTVRFSFNYFNTKDEIDEVLSLLKNL